MIFSVLLYMLTGVGVFILFILILALIIGIAGGIIAGVDKAYRYIKRQRGKGMNEDIERYEGHTPDTPRYSLANCTRSLASTAVETMPERELSNMDRDPKLQTATFQEPWDLEAALSDTSGI